jgi:sortase A
MPFRKTTLVWSERILFSVGIAALAWCVFAVGESWLTQRAGARSVASAAALAATPARGAPIAKLQIPRLGVSSVVLEGDDDRTLRLGPGHIAGTAMPGRTGNIGIAGHRDTFFRPLRNVRVGDRITLTVGKHRFAYQVSSLRIVGPDDVSVLDPTPRKSLTLVTCYPFSVFGHAPDRFVVRAGFIGEVAS